MIGDDHANDIYRQALKRWGCDAQLRMLAEECSECAAEALRALRNRHHNLPSELADVEIMCAQMRIVLGDSEVEAAKQEKLKRLECMLDRDLEAQKEDRAQVTRMGLLDMQVCVPSGWTDEEVRAFAERECPCGTTLGWQIRREGDERLAGAHERVPCASRAGFVHVVLDA